MVHVYFKLAAEMFYNNTNPRVFYLQMMCRDSTAVMAASWHALFWLDNMNPYKTSHRLEATCFLFPFPVARLCWLLQLPEVTCPIFQMVRHVSLMVMFILVVLTLTFLYIYIFIISECGNSTGSWNPSLWKTRTLLSWIFSAIVADDLATQATVSAAVVSSWAPSQYKDRLIYVWRFPC